MTSVADLTMCCRSPGSVSPAALSPKGMADNSGVVPAVPAFTTGTASIPVFDSSIESFAMNIMVSRTTALLELEHGKHALNAIAHYFDLMKIAREAF